MRALRSPSYAQRLPPPLQRLLEQRPRLLQLTQIAQQPGRFINRLQRVFVAVAQCLPVRPHRLLAHLQLLLAQQPRLLRLAHLRQQVSQAEEQQTPRPLSLRQPPPRCPPLSDQGLAQQADDQRVALVEAHALLQLGQNVGLVLGIAAVRLCIRDGTLLRSQEVCVAGVTKGIWYGAGVLQPPNATTGCAVLAPAARPPATAPP